MEYVVQHIEARQLVIVSGGCAGNHEIDLRDGATQLNGLCCMSERADVSNH